MKIKLGKWNGKVFSVGFVTGMIYGSLCGGLAFLLLLNFISK